MNRTHDFGQMPEYFEVLGKEFDDFYLVGGTALSYFYLDHRRSDDIDLFTPEEIWVDLSWTKIQQRLSTVKQELGVTIEPEITFESEEGERVGGRFLISYEEESTKLDLVMDAKSLKTEPEVKEGIRVAGIDDLYDMKLMLALETGNSCMEQLADEQSGRRKVRDLLDIYTLSIDHVPLSYKLHGMGLSDPLPQASDLKLYVEQFNHQSILNQGEETGFSLEEHPQNPRAIQDHLLEEVDRYMEQKVTSKLSSEDEE